MDLKRKMKQIMTPDSPSPFSNENWPGFLDDDVFDSNIDIVISEVSDSKPSDEFIAWVKK